MIVVRFFLAVGLIAASHVSAQVRPDSVPGWTRTNEDGDTIPGVLVDSRQIAQSSPVIANIDGDLSNGLEIAVAGIDGTITVLQSDGTVRWQAVTPNQDCVSSGKRVRNSGPAVGDLEGDGTPDVVIGFAGSSKKCGGGVVAFDGLSGEQKWVFDVMDDKPTERLTTVFGTVALADVDGDGDDEVGFGSWSRYIYLLNGRNGKKIGIASAADTVWSSPAFVNIDSDSRLEMIIGTDISKNTLLNPPTPNGGRLLALDPNDLKDGLNFREPSDWALTYSKQVIMSSPVVADVLQSRSGKEVVVGTGCFFPQGSRNKLGNRFLVVNAQTGKLIKQLRVGACSSSSPAVADLDGDGALDIVATANGQRSNGGDGFGRVHAWKNGKPLWTAIPLLNGKNDASLGEFKSPVVADLDHNGSPEVIVSNRNGVVILNGVDGRQLTCSTTDCFDNTPKIALPSTVQNSPAVGDINNDGVLDLIVATSTGGKGVVYAFTNFEEILGSTPGVGATGAVPWAQHRGDSQRRGRSLE